MVWGLGFNLRAQGLGHEVSQAVPGNTNPNHTIES